MGGKGATSWLGELQAGDSGGRGASRAQVDTAALQPLALAGHVAAEQLHAAVREAHRRRGDAAAMPARCWLVVHRQLRHLTRLLRLLSRAPGGGRGRGPGQATRSIER